MFDRLRGPRVMALAVTALLGVDAASLSAAAPQNTPSRTPATAQATPSSRDSVVLYELRLREARSALDSARGVARSVPDDSLSVEGATVLFVGAMLPDGDRRRLRLAFARAADQLARDLGPSGRALLAGTRWRLSLRSYVGAVTRTIGGFEPIPSPPGRSVAALRLPLNESEVAQRILDHAGQLLLSRNPRVSAWLSSRYSFRGSDIVYDYAARELVVHGRVRGSSCARGVIEDCAIILDPARFDEWFVEGESNRGLVPASENVRSSVFQYAMQRGGEGFVAAFTATPGDSTTPPVQILARAAGISPEELLRGWQQSLLGSGAARAGVSPTRTLSTLAWVLLFAIIATRRRIA